MLWNVFVGCGVICEQRVDSGCSEVSVGNAGGVALWEISMNYGAYLQIVG